MSYLRLAVEKVPYMIFICKLLKINCISRESFLRILYCLFSHICFILSSFERADICVVAY